MKPKFETKVVLTCWGTTIWLPTTILKIGPRGVILKAIKDLIVSFSSPIGFEMKWHSLRSDITWEDNKANFEKYEQKA